jgi:hypothetical protein
MSMKLVSSHYGWYVDEQYLGDGNLVEYLGP